MYNGFSNYETWVSATHLDNEERTYNHYREKAQELDREALGRYMQERMASEVARYADSLPGLYGDLLQAGLLAVDFNELAGIFYA